MSDSIEAPAAADLGGDPAPLPDTHREPGSLRERLEAAYDSIEEREAEKEPAAEAPEAEPKPERPAAVRSPDGKFAAKNPPAEPAAPKVEPPAWLPKGAGVDWNRLPRTVQEALAAAAPQSAQQPQQAPPAPQQTPDPLRSSVQQYAHHFARRGIAPEAGVASLLHTYDRLEQDPAGTLQWLAQQYGVSLGAPAPQQQPQHHASPEFDGTSQGQLPDIERHPVVQQLRQQLAQLTEGHSAVQQTLQAQQREANARRVAEAAMQIEKFANDPDNPRPHFDAVKEDMALLIRAGRAADLASAYDMAVWGRADIRAALLQEQQAKMAAEQAKQAQERAAAARRAALVNARTSPTAPVVQGQKPSLRETMERVAAGIE